MLSKPTRSSILAEPMVGSCLNSALLSHGCTLSASSTARSSSKLRPVFIHTFSIPHYDLTTPALCSSNSPTLASPGSSTPHPALQLRGLHRTGARHCRTRLRSSQPLHDGRLGLQHRPLCHLCLLTAVLGCTYWRKGAQVVVGQDRKGGVCLAGDRVRPAAAAGGIRGDFEGRRIGAVSGCEADGGQAVGS